MTGRKQDYFIEAEVGLQASRHGNKFGILHCQSLENREGRGFVAYSRRQEHHITCLQPPQVSVVETRGGPAQ